MPKQIVARVYTDYEGGEYGPDYALIEVEPTASVANLELRMQDTIEMSLKHCGEFDSLASGPLQGTIWWLSDMPLEVTWLYYAALYDEQGEEPGWIPELLDEGWVVVEGFGPNCGGKDCFGHPENQFTTVDLQYVLLMPDGNFEVQANIECGGATFRTCEVPLSKLIES